MTKYALNHEHAGIELYFSEKPNSDTINTLKVNGWKWHGGKKCWYNKQTPETMKQAEQFTNGEQPEAEQEKKPSADKAKQAELKARYAEILKRDVWQKDQHMVDYCVKKSAYIVEMENGDIITIEKPSIEKDFCFGYRLSRSDTEEYDDANKMAHHAKTNEDYFMQENLKGLNEILEILQGDGNGDHDYYISIPYYKQPINSQLKSLVCHRWHEDGAKTNKRLEGADRARVIEGYKIVKADFEKRLQIYLKRYGMSKVNTWSYWQDA